MTENPWWKHPLARWQANPIPVQHLLMSEFLGLLATASMQLSMAWWVSGRGGARALAFYAAVTGAAALVATPLLSPAGDRWPKARLIRAGKACLVLDAALLLALCAAGSFDLALLCACGLLAVAATALLLPVEASALPELLAPCALPGAIRQRRAMQAAGGLLGPALAGALLASAGLTPTMTVNLVLCVVAAVAAWRLRFPAQPAAAGVNPGWLADIADGLRAKWHVRLDRWWTLVGALMAVCLLPATGLLLPLRIQSLGLTAAWFGASGAALSGGILLGLGWVAPTMISRLGRIGALALAIAICATAMAGAGWLRQASALVAMFGLIGVSLSVTQLVGQTHRMLAMPEDYRARMSAAHLMIAQLAAASAPLVAGTLLQHTSVQGAYLLLAAGFGASGLLLLAVPGLGAFLREDHAGASNWYGRRYPHAFKRR